MLSINNASPSPALSFADGKIYTIQYIVYLFCILCISAGKHSYYQTVGGVAYILTEAPFFSILAQMFYYCLADCRRAIGTTNKMAILHSRFMQYLVVSPTGC